MPDVPPMFHVAPRRRDEGSHGVARRRASDLRREAAASSSAAKNHTPGTMPRARKEEVKKQAASYNLSVTTNRLKGHLGTAPSADAQQRDTAHSSAAGIADERLSEAQLVRKAQAIHDDTTATAERALRVRAVRQLACTACT
eukprot:365193-Chlamydomonas_euryale.AAC.13